MANPAPGTGCAGTPSATGVHNVMDAAHQAILTNHANHDATHAQNPGVNAANVPPKVDQNFARG
jgi:hypothetical protein